MQIIITPQDNVETVLATCVMLRKLNYPNTDQVLEDLKANRANVVININDRQQAERTLSDLNEDLERYCRFPDSINVEIKPL